jgi:2-phosphoglycerate kinase
MIYLISGSPRVGKSIIDKQFAEYIKGRFVSTDDLEDPNSQQPSVIFYSDPKKNILKPIQRIESVKNEAKQIISEIEDIISKSVDKHQNTVIEGVHLFPSYVDKFVKKFGKEKIKVIFIGSTNIDLILDGMKKNTSPNNWLKEFNQEVLRQIAKFTKAFSDYLYHECKRYNFLYKERSNDFQKDIRNVIKELK